MLTIHDLHNEQELSSFEMHKVAGGDGKPVHKVWAGNKVATLASVHPIALDPLTHPESQILSSTFVGLED